MGNEWFAGVIRKTWIDYGLFFLELDIVFTMLNK